MTRPTYRIQWQKSTPTRKPSPRRNPWTQVHVVDQVDQVTRCGRRIPRESEGYAFRVDRAILSWAEPCRTCLEADRAEPDPTD